MVCISMFTCVCTFTCGYMCKGMYVHFCMCVYICVCMCVCIEGGGLYSVSSTICGAVVVYTRVVSFSN